MELNEAYHDNRQPAAHQEDRDAMRDALIGHQAQNALAFQTQAIKEFGPQVGIFLRQLLFWEGRGKCEDGFIYKSEREWYEETGLKRTNQRTARKKLKAEGVLEEELRQPWPGARLVMHYRLKLEKLLGILGPHLDPEPEREDTQAESVGVSGQEVPASRSSEENNRIVPLTGGAGAPPGEGKSKEGKAADCGETPPHKANKFVGIVVTGLRKEPGVDLDKTQRRKIGQDFRRLIRDRTRAEDLDAAAKRIVERWADHQLTPGEALGDVTGVGKTRPEPTPEAAVEAIRADEYFGENGPMAKVRLWEVARLWDFRREVDPPMWIRKRISESRQECDLWLPQLRSIATRAHRKVEEERQDIPIPLPVPKRDRPPIEFVLDDSDRARIRRLAEDPKTRTGHLAQARAEGRSYTHRGPEGEAITLADVAAVAVEETHRYGATPEANEVDAYALVLRPMLEGQESHQDGASGPAPSPVG